MSKTNDDNLMFLSDSLEKLLFEFKELRSEVSQIESEMAVISDHFGRQNQLLSGLQEHLNKTFRKEFSVTADDLEVQLEQMADRQLTKTDSNITTINAKLDTIITRLSS